MHRQYPDQEDNALLYMAMTRAEDVLVILHSGASGLIAKIGAALEANGAPGFAGSGSTETPRVLYPTGH
jgi:hypothetical protein